MYNIHIFYIVIHIHTYAKEQELHCRAQLRASLAFGRFAGSTTSKDLGFEMKGFGFFFFWGPFSSLLQSEYLVGRVSGSGFRVSGLLFWYSHSYTSWAMLRGSGFRVWAALRPVEELPLFTEALHLVLQLAGDMPFPMNILQLRKSKLNFCNT